MRNKSQMQYVTAIVGAALAALSFAMPAYAQERTVAGSAQGAYLAVVSEEPGRAIGFDGFTTEVSLKIAADVSDSVSAQAKLCFGCHGFEVAMAFADIRAGDAFNFRVGRFNPSFGEFPLRHDPANHATVDKPLPYDMGRMLQMKAWNMSVLPAPYVDNGLEVSGVHWFGDSFSVDYALYAVSGFRGGSEPSDFDFKLSRSGEAYYVDNNSRPSGGGRLAFTWAPEEFTLTMGVSAMGGWYDPDADYSYVVGGADVYFRIGRFNLRAEYLLRRTEMALSDDPASRFKYGPGPDGKFDNYFYKDGFYAEGEYEAASWLKLVGRADGMRRIGNIEASSPLSRRSYVMRYTAGVNFLPERSVRIKVFGQYYDFNDLDDEITVQLAAAAMF